MWVPPEYIKGCLVLRQRQLLITYYYVKLTVQNRHITNWWWVLVLVLVGVWALNISIGNKLCNILKVNFSESMEMFLNYVLCLWDFSSSTKADCFENSSLLPGFHVVLKSICGWLYFSLSLTDISTVLYLKIRNPVALQVL